MSTLLAQLGPTPPGDAVAAERQRAAATRLAFLFRREARNDRNLLVLAAQDELEPKLRARLEALVSPAHVIKLTESLLSEHAIDAKPVYLAAAEAAVG